MLKLHFKGLLSIILHLQVCLSISKSVYSPHVYKIYEYIGQIVLIHSARDKEPQTTIIINSSNIISSPLYPPTTTTIIIYVNFCVIYTYIHIIFYFCYKNVK